MHDRAQWENRYSRQIRFAPIGGDGQRRLGDKAVLIAGTGALGASLAQHMARAGVGQVWLVDRDYVEPSNLQRQVLFDEEDALQALPKAVAAARKLKRINGGVRIEALVADIGHANISSLFEGIDLVLDGTDNAQTRLVLSDECFKRGIPLIYGGAAGSQGMTAALVPGETACLRCLIGGEPDGADDGLNCDLAGVISPAVEAVAALQAAEALKWLSGSELSVRRTWVGLDVWRFAVREVALPGPRADCALCCSAGSAARERAAPPDSQPQGLEDSTADETVATATLLCGRDTVQVTLATPLPLADAGIRLERSGGELLAANGYLQKWAVPEGERIVVFDGGRALVQGTSDERRAVRLCLKYLRDGREPA